MEIGDDGESENERKRMQKLVGNAEVFKGDCQVVGDGRFGDFTENERTNGDAELAGGEIDREM